MDKELEKYYSDLQEMFLTNGWKELIKELADNSVNINSVKATIDNNNLYFRKGQLDTIDYILNLESTVDLLQVEDSNEGV
jgi:hypothetical protein|tara:strand:- start:40 stop:279 length:240 start_codon:yes stop_codon:yes gene_type:complete